MKLIILRGLPGCGKSIIAEKLGEKLDNPVIHGDFFKREYMKNNSDFKNSDVYQYSYNKIFEKIKDLFKSGEKFLIVEELFNDKDLVEKIKDHCLENNIEIKSFFIQRDLEKLLALEEVRGRKIKNTQEDFKKLEKEIKDIKI
ncbi:zeta toxin family protein [Patescibacteria group bacterium]|nr:zeta toxin family protein [Patescibacteria group bacterium]